MTGPATLDRIYTVDEAAERLRLTRRGAIKVGKRYGLCSIFGRHILFTEKNLIDLVEAMRYKPSSVATGARYLAAFESGRTEGRLRAMAEARRQERARQQEERRQALLVERTERQAKEAIERERRLEEKRERSRAKVEADAAKRAARQVKAQASSSGVIDHDNRDPSYWTAARKKILRNEREARLRDV